MSMGKKLRLAVDQSFPLQVVGTINAYLAIMAEQVGFKALYLSGAGVANASFGLPDLGMTNLSDVLEEARRITSVSSLPLLVDVDTGFGHALGIARTVKEMERAGVAGIHIEDQQTAKRCGHRPNKTIVSLGTMTDRIKAAVDARSDPHFVIMARTDAYAVFGIQEALDRTEAYVNAGADMIFPEAIPELAIYKQFTEKLCVPVLANITEFGKTPLFSTRDLSHVGIKLALYPLSAFRAMSQAALTVFKTVYTKGSQEDVLNTMQTRDELYKFLHYLEYEDKLNLLTGENK